MILMQISLSAVGLSKDVKYDFSLSYDLPAHKLIFSLPNTTTDSVRIQINEAIFNLRPENGIISVPHSISRSGEILAIRLDATSLQLYHLSQRSNGSSRLLKIPLWLSILPPIVAIALALIFKEVIISLFIGIWSGAFIVGGLRIDAPWYLFQSFLDVVEKYVVSALVDSGHMSVIVFSLLIGGMVAIISKNGGMAGVVKSLSKYATSPKRAQFITWLLGVAIFFDDYANTLVVGNTMRSVTDRFKVSREKLAYIVDSTAAPVAAVAFITTWIGAELGYIDGGMKQIDNFNFDLTPYALFVSSLKYSFYPILTLVFMLFIIGKQRDFGPMLSAEIRARTTGQVSSASTPEEDEPNMEDLTPVKNAPLKWQHAFFPVITVIVVTVLGLVSTGMDALYSSLQQESVIVAEAWSDVWRNMHLLHGTEEFGFFRKIGILVGKADSYIALLWASACGAALAIAITLYNRTMNMIETMYSLTTGFKSMMPAIIILTLAWSLAITTEQLHTATFLSSALAGNIHPYLIPVLIFVLSATIAFSTGSSWSTMAILYPIAIPTSWAVCEAVGLDSAHSLEILLNVIATVLGASVLGDHCSPISDTTILSSLASDCNHIDHVRTQMPYALTVGFVSIICTGLSTALGGGWLISFVLAGLALLSLYVIVSKFGRRISDQS